jgi:hypothetical protein
MRKKLAIVVLVLTPLSVVGSQLSVAHRENPQTTDNRQPTTTPALLKQTQLQADNKSARLRLLPRRHRADARIRGGEARLHRLPRRQRHRAHQTTGAHPAAQRGPLEDLRESAAHVHRAPRRIARVRPLHQSRRSPRRARNVRRLPHDTSRRGAAQHDDHQRRVLGRRQLRERHRRSEARLPRRVYNRDGKPQILLPAWPPTPQQIANGALPQLVPLPRWEIFQPGGEYFRAFERGGIANGTMPPDTGNPSPNEDAGRPDIRLGNRGRGTGSRISPGLINLHKTRLNDPHLSFLGTNDHPGDYRSSGCSACHVVYANDRDPLHSGPWASAAHRPLADRRSVDSARREGPSDPSTSSRAPCPPASA